MKELIPGTVKLTVPNTKILWNTNRWTQTMQLVRNLNKLTLPHDCFRRIFPTIVGADASTKALEDVSEFRAIVAAEGVLSDKALALSCTELHRAEKIRTKNTVNWLCLPYQAGATGKAELTLLNNLILDYEPTLQHHFHLGGDAFEVEQLVREHEEGERKYPLLEFAAGRVSLPLLGRLSATLQNSWRENKWVTYVAEAGTTLRSTARCVKVYSRMYGSLMVRSVSKLRLYPYKRYLTMAELNDEELIQRGKTAVESDPGCVMGDSKRLLPVLGASAADFEERILDQNISMLAVAEEVRPIMVEVEFLHGDYKRGVIRP